MKIKLTEAELHTPLFLGGVNWGLKLHQAKNPKGRLELAYDRENKELLVSANGAIAIIPASNVAWMAPEKDGAAVAQVEESPVVSAPRRKVRAQVGGPTDHVHGGAGAGRKND